jgi:antitoxin component of MazEF toxin-antitoxin module
MASQARKTDKRGRVTLAPDFANQLVVIERVCYQELRIRKSKGARLRLILAELLARVTPKNVHGEVKTGRAVGGEVW